MKDRVFLDTNILVYLYTVDDIKKRNAASAAIMDKDCRISVQVLNEFSSVCLRKMNMPVSEVLAALEQITSYFGLVSLSPKTVRDALRLYDRYGYAYYDCLIIAAALQGGCDVLFTEDLADSQIIDDRLIIKNVFLP